MTPEEQKTADAAAAAKAAADAKTAEDAAAVAKVTEDAAAAEAAAAADKAKTAKTAKTAEQYEAEIALLDRAVKDANKEAKDRRLRLKQLEDAETTRQQAEMTETDKLKAELETARAEAVKAETNAREMLIRSEFVAEAAKANVAHPEDVYLLADRSEVDVDESGKVTGVAEAVKALVDAGRVPLSGHRPAPKLDGGAGNGDRDKAQVKLTQIEMDTARRMGISLERYAAQKTAMAKEEQAV